MPEPTYLALWKPCNTRKEKLDRRTDRRKRIPCFLFMASSIVPLVENPPAMQETPVRFLGQEDPLEKE